MFAYLDHRLYNVGAKLFILLQIGANEHMNMTLTVLLNFSVTLVHEIHRHIGYKSLMKMMPKKSKVLIKVIGNKTQFPHFFLFSLRYKI